MATLLGLIPSLVALAAPRVASLVSTHVLALCFGALFVGVGAFESAARISSTNLLLDIAPAQERSLYIGFTNTVLGVALLLASVAGAIVQVAGYAALFSLALVMGLAALVMSLGLEEPRKRSV
jgi:MFS family permease